jgi:hypothetical protein
MLGRTVPSFRLALAMEERRWKPFRYALDKSDRGDFDSMFAVPRLYLSACSYSSQTVRIYPILISILLHCYRQLAESIQQVKSLLGEIEEIYNEPVSR